MHPGTSDYNSYTLGMSYPGKMALFLSFKKSCYRALCSKTNNSAQRLMILSKYLGTKLNFAIYPIKPTILDTVYFNF